MTIKKKTTRAVQLDPDDEAGKERVVIDDKEMDETAPAPAVKLAPLELLVNGGESALINYQYFFTQNLPAEYKTSSGLWTSVSGPDSNSKVIFGSPSNFKTTMRFTSYGRYELSFLPDGQNKITLVAELRDPKLDFSLSKFIGIAKPTNLQELKIAAGPSKVVLIYSHLSAQQTLQDVCSPDEPGINGGLVPQLRTLSNKRIGDKTITSLVYCPINSRGVVNGRVVSEFKTTRIAKELETVLDLVLSQGVPAKQIFLTGWSGGAWSALLAAKTSRAKFNSIIGFAPSFAGLLVDRMNDAALSNAMTQQSQDIAKIPQLDALVFSSELDDFDTPMTLNFLSKIPGVKIRSYNSSNAQCGSTDWHEAFFEPCLANLSGEIESFITEKIKP